MASSHTTGCPALLVLGLTAVTFLSLEGVAAVVDAGCRGVNGVAR